MADGSHSHRENRKVESQKLIQDLVTLEVQKRMYVYDSVLTVTTKTSKKKLEVRRLYDARVQQIPNFGIRIALNPDYDLGPLNNLITQSSGNESKVRNCLLIATQASPIRSYHS